jgi:hypothetical protein
VLEGYVVMGWGWMGIVCGLTRVLFLLFLLLFFINLDTCLYFVWNSYDVRMAVWCGFCIWVVTVIHAKSNYIIIHHNHIHNIFVGNTISTLQSVCYTISLTICRYKVL